MMSSRLLQVRWWQIRKELTGIGLLYAALVVAIIAIMAFAAFMYYLQTPHAYLVAGLVVAGVASLHLGRRDLDFVCRHIPRPEVSMYTEYVVFTLPFTLPVLATRQAWLFMAMQLAFRFITVLKWSPRQVTRYRFLSGWIAPRDFEWLSGIRRSFAWMAILYLLSWLATPLMVAPLVPLWLITVQISSFYTECEPLNILRAGNDAAFSFLWKKIKRHAGMLWLISLPVLALGSLFRPDMLWINLGFALAQLILLVFSILLKYAVYQPDRDLKGNSILMGIAALSAAIPFLLPLPLLLSLRNYGKAIRNLKNYIDDRDP